MPNPVDQRILRRVCNNLRLGELIEGRYVLNTSTCRWSQHLLQAAANEGYTDHFPVHVLRRLIDEPAAFGFDRELQNLIIVVFGLEQQLAWYQHGGKVDVTNLALVRDELELRHPPMPDEQAWRDTVRRGSAIFGGVLPVWRTPANLGELAGTLRTAASTRAKAARDLVEALEAHADVLGLDASAPTGRLATARRAARLVTELATERDDVVLVETVARADLGDVDDQAVGELLSQAGTILNAMARGHQWSLLQAISARAAHDEQAQAIIGQLREVARHQQHGQDLVDALQTAVDASAALLATNPPQDRTVNNPGGAPNGGDGPHRHGAGAAAARESGPVEVPANGGDGGPGRAAEIEGTGGAGPVAVAGGDRLIAVAHQRREVADAATWEKVAAEIAAEVTAGRRVTVTWEIR
ncbi:hypothetical protein NKG94_45805 [Micromonospora sp. M12]